MHFNCFDRNVRSYLRVDFFPFRGVFRVKYRQITIRDESRSDPQDSYQVNGRIVQALFRGYGRADFRRYDFRDLTVRFKCILLTRFFMVLLYNDLRRSIRRLATYATLRTYCGTTGKQGGFRFEVVLISGRKSPNRRVFLLFRRRLQDRS